MKTKLSLALATLAFAPCALAADTCPCCAVETAAPAAQACCAEEKPAAPLSNKSLYQLDAKFTDDTGRMVQLASLRGQPVILAMFFASCEYACPMLVNDIQRLRAELPATVRAKARVVLVTFDVARDTPAALATYRERMKLDGAWTLLHGDNTSVQDLAMLLGVKYKQDVRGQFSHSNLITVLNAEGEIAHQRAGLMGDISEAAKAVALVAVK